MEVIFELIVTIIQPIVQAFFEIILMIFHFFVKKFPRLGTIFLCGVAGILFYHDYFIAAGMFGVAASIIFGLYVRNRKNKA